MGKKGVGWIDGELIRGTFKCCGISVREDDELMLDDERFNDISIDETDKEKDVFAEIEGEHYEEVDGFRNVW